MEKLNNLNINSNNNSNSDNATKTEVKKEDNTEINNYKCNKPGCDKDGKLRCPNCKKYGIKNESYFCGKECFTSYWASHKQIHEECKRIN